MIYILVALAVCLVGAVTYLLMKGKTGVAELALYAFAVGLLVTLLSVSGSCNLETHPPPAGMHGR
jgi:hypothetical protein